MVLRYIEATTTASVGGMVEPITTPRQQEAAAQRDATKLAKRLAKA